MAQVFMYSHHAKDYVTQEVRNLDKAKKEARSWGANRFRYISRNGEREFGRSHWSVPWQEI